MVTLAYIANIIWAIMAFYVFPLIYLVLAFQEDGVDVGLLVHAVVAVPVVLFPPIFNIVVIRRLHRRCNPSVA
ncbi:hypothetical protein ACERK3_13910 [Phycisphaerales bacterium AB-hyl4]|uniref:Uncharacterized protein n=1 Tax=Natronomicrosphaera hydrolytica TaxID=3242702 RepID=A0ABV4U9I1_9BACT